MRLSKRHICRGSRFHGEGLQLSRVFVLALDGLDHDLVVQWNLKHLLQKQYGKIETIINKQLGLPTSPQVWGSFITGRIQEIDSWHAYNRILEWVRKKSPLKLIKGKRKLSFRVGLRPDIVSRKHLSGKTIFDEIPKSIAINVPTYNPRASEFIDLLGTKLKAGLEAWEKECYLQYQETVDEIFRKIGDEWDIFMVWIPIADQLGHLGRKVGMKAVYRKLNLLAYNVSTMCPRNTLLTIVSDHGIRFLPDGTGTHTTSAFYSFSRKTGWAPREITDFYRFLTSYIKSGVEEVN